MTPYTIYALTDPRSGLLCYVGATRDPSERLRRHVISVRARDGATTPVRQWMTTLSELGLEPVLRILEVVPYEDRASAEAEWITWLRDRGVDLLNVRGGGAGVHHRSAAARRNLSAAAKNSERVQAARERALLVVRGSVNSPTHRARIAAAKRGVPISEEHRRATSATNFGRERSKETRERVSAAKKGRPHSATHRAANAAAQLRRATMDIAARDARIRALRAGGMVLRDIAQEVGLSPGRVSVILHKESA